MQLEAFVSIVGLLLIVIDPIGNIPLFISLLKQVDPQRRRWVILRESGIAFLILVFFAFFGRQLLDIMHLSQQAITIAGGIVLFLISLPMMFPPSSGSSGINHQGEPLIVPLAVPMLAGPATIATILVSLGRAPDLLMTWLVALAVAMLLSTLVLLFCEKIGQLVGEKVTMAFERLMGLVLAALAVEMLLQGIASFVSKL